MDLIQRIEELKPQVSKEVLKDGTIINTLVTRNGNVVTTRVETIPPEQQQKIVADAHAKAEAILAEVAPLETTLKSIQLNEVEK